MNAMIDGVDYQWDRTQANQRRQPTPGGTIRQIFREQPREEHQPVDGEPGYGHARSRLPSQAVDELDSCLLSAQGVCDGLVC